MNSENTVEVLQELKQLNEFISKTAEDEFNKLNNIEHNNDNLSLSLTTHNEKIENIFIQLNNMNARITEMEHMLITKKSELLKGKLILQRNSMVYGVPNKILPAYIINDIVRHWYLYYDTLFLLNNAFIKLNDYQNILLVNNHRHLYVHLYNIIINLRHGIPKNNSIKIIKPGSRRSLNDIIFICNYLTYTSYTLNRHILKISKHIKKLTINRIKYKYKEFNDTDKYDYIYCTEDNGMKFSSHMYSIPDKLTNKIKQKKIMSVHVRNKKYNIYSLRKMKSHIPDNIKNMSIEPIDNAQYFGYSGGNELNPNEIN
jgi:hypothetical protein